MTKLERAAMQMALETIETLWDIIDDIDTYGDMAKADEKLYRSLVERKQRERFKTGITTDGYTLNDGAITALREALAQPQGEPVAYEVGGWYKQLNGKWVQFVGVANAGTSYETMFCSDGIHRYTKRDYGRATGTAHDYSCLVNTPPLYTTPPSVEAAANKTRTAILEYLVDSGSLSKDSDTYKTIAAQPLDQILIKEK